MLLYYQNHPHQILFHALNLAIKEIKTETHYALHKFNDSAGRHLLMRKLAFKFVAITRL